MEHDTLKARLEVAFEALIHNDSEILRMDAGERAITALLARYLQGVFPSHHVDAEYNRHGVEPKRLDVGSECEHNEDKLVCPDIIIHHRGNDENNLLVSEIKKSTNRSPRHCDRAKLHAIKDEYNYLYAALIEIRTGIQDFDGTYNIEWIE